MILLYSTLGKNQEVGRIISGSNFDDLTGQAFVLTYDPNILELLDFAAQTGAHSLEGGEIPGTQLETLSHADGELVFTYGKDIPMGQEWFGVITMLKFEALQLWTTGGPKLRWVATSKP